jgi:U3 small nucleolar RNA-associated protein 12
MQGGKTVVVNDIVQQGNNSDVRALALSEDDRFVISCGNGGTKVWDAASGECLNSIATGYGLSCLFAPRSRYAVIGCKNGKLVLVHLGAAAVMEELDAHQSQVWFPVYIHDASSMP